METSMAKHQYTTVQINPSEITPEEVYINRRQFMKAIGVASLSGLVLAACGSSGSGSTIVPQPTDPAMAAVGQQTDELGDPVNTFEQITNYNNYYEFTTDKARVAKLSENFVSSPWTIEVSGLVNNARSFGLEDIEKMFPAEERIYRLRCVEAWSMVIPWMGFSLKSMLDLVEPTGDAQYVAFTSLNDPSQMPGQKSRMFPWPYTEGLRLDEAMNDLTILATGLYGKPLPAQDGAPIRLVVPWKYGFKSIKAIVKIELTDRMPDTLWNLTAPQEYGFYANVNPTVDHPRWSQATERRIGEFSRRETLMFNGYEEQVAYLYDGMDLARNF
jgi:sulfoxide reductase catalytic subunit YedY